MPARLLLGLALLWAVLVPALHGHAAGAAGHLHAGGDHTLAISHVASADVSEVSEDVAAHGQGVHDADVHTEALDAEASDRDAQDDLPVAWESALWVLITGLALAWVAPRREGVSEDRTPDPRPRVRGSPVARHELARI